MGARSRKAQRQSQLRRGAVSAFFVELGLGLLAIPSAALGLMAVAAFFQSAAEQSTGLLSGIVGYGIALAATAIGFLLVGWVATFLVAPMTVGWLAMFSGQIPLEYSPQARNHARAAANLTMMTIALVLGVMLFRYGVREGEATYAVEGIFLAAAGIVLGLAPAVPRLYFARKKGEAEPVDSEKVIGFILTVALGLALSLAVSFTLTAKQRPKGPKVLRHGLWHHGCVAKQSTTCPLSERFRLVAAQAGRYYVDKRPLCGDLLFEAAAGAKANEVRWGQLRREGVTTYDKKQEMRTRALELKAGEMIEIEVSAARYAATMNLCTYKLRVRPAASAGGRR